MHAQSSAYHLLRAPSKTQRIRILPGRPQAKVPTILPRPRFPRLNPFRLRPPPLVDFVLLDHALVDVENDLTGEASAKQAPEPTLPPHQYRQKVVGCFPGGALDGLGELPMPFWSETVRRVLVE